MIKVITMNYHDFIAVHPHWKTNLLDCNYIVTNCNNPICTVMAIRNDKNQMQTKFFETKQEALNWLRGYYYKGGKAILC